MNQFTGPDIHPGDKVTFVNGDKTWTQTIDGISYRSGGIVYEDLTRWQEFLRRITPNRWRKPRPYHYEPVSVQIHCDDPMWRAGQKLAGIAAAMKSLDEERAAHVNQVLEAGAS